MDNFLLYFIVRAEFSFYIRFDDFGDRIVFAGSIKTDVYIPVITGILSNLRPEFNPSNKT